MLAGRLAGASGFAAAAPSGDESFASGDFTSAEVAYGRVLATEPADLDANVGAARIDLYRGCFVEARAHARAAVAADASNIAAAGLIGAIDREEAAAHAPDVAPARGDVDVPFVQTDPLPMVRILVNGRVARMILDTGAPGVDVSAAFAASAGIAETATGRARFAGDRTAKVATGGVARTLRIGSITMHDVPAGVAPTPPGVDGVLGTTFFARFLTTIDYVDARMILRAKHASQEVETAAAVRGDSIVPMYLVPDHYLFVSGRVNDGPEALFDVDTGGGPMVGVDLTKASLERARITPDALHGFPFLGGGGAVVAQPFTAASVTIGHTRIIDVPGVYVPAVEPHLGPPFTSAGRISHAFFRHTSITFDFDAMKLLVSRPSPRTEKRAGMKQHASRLEPVATS